MTVDLQGLAAQREALDAQLRLLDCEKRSLSERYNSLQAIHFLPVEILSRIFSAFAKDSSTNSSLLRDVIRLSHVCRHWRQIVLSMPVLWASFDIDGLGKHEVHHVLSELLQRSQRAPIRLSIDVSSWVEASPRRAVKAAFQVLHHLTHIRKLSIVAGKPDTTEWFEYLRTTPAPTLEKLKVWCCESEPFHIPDTMFDGAMPQLRRLTLCMCLISPTNALLAEITQLKLNHCLEELHYTQMLPVLANIPRLEDLLIEEEESEFTPEDLDLAGRARIPLPRLKKLELSGPVPFMAALSNLLLPPSSASIVIRNEMDPINGDNASLVRLVRTGVIQEQNPLRALYLCGNISRNTFLIQGSRTGPYAPTLNATSSDLHMRFEDLDRFGRSEILAAYLSTANLDCLEELEVYDIFPDVPWRAVFARMPNVQKLSIGEYANTCRIIEALMPPSQRNETDVSTTGVANEAGTNVFLPKLSWIGILGSWVKELEDAEEELEEFLERLEKCLEARRRSRDASNPVATSFSFILPDDVDLNIVQMLTRHRDQSEMWVGRDVADGEVDESVSAV